MKKILLTLTAVFLSILVFAQTTEHLSFKGIPIDGSLEEFISKMKENGFKHLGTEDGIGILKGDFAGYTNCNIGVSFLKHNNLVYKIAVMFPDAATWSALSSNYFDLKDMLTKKYGSPSDVIEKFNGYSEPKDDISKIYEVKLGRCKYYSIWRTDKGNIQLTIGNTSEKSCYIFLGYSDKINSVVAEKNAQDDL